MGKRLAGEGSIYQRADGRYCAALRYEDPTTGARRRKVLYGKTATEVGRKLKAATRRAERGAPLLDSTATVSAWLAHWSDEPLRASNRKATTQELYRHIVKKHLQPAALGALSLARLRPSHIDTLILDLRAKKLADSTVRQIYTVLRQALAAAVRDGLLAANPSEKVPRPSVARTEARFLSNGDVAALLTAAATSRYYTLLWVIATTGLRKGEALALKWTDLDLKAGTLAVRGTLSRVDGALVVTEPKTASSRRVLPLSPAVVAVLKAQKRTQTTEKLHAGNLWRDSGHVFTTEAGGPVEPRNVLRAFATAAKAAKITGANVHTLRHSAATGWLEAGYNLKAVSDLLGHSDISITGNIYAHTSQETARAAMETRSAALGM